MIEERKYSVLLGVDSTAPSGEKWRVCAVEAGVWNNWQDAHSWALAQLGRRASDVLNDPDSPDVCQMDASEAELRLSVRGFTVEAFTDEDGTQEFTNGGCRSVRSERTGSDERTRA